MSSEEIADDFSPCIIVYKDGRIERLYGNDTVPPSTDPKTGVQSKDVLFSQEPPISARLYIPTSTTIATSANKLPVVLYFHGGGFCVETAASPTYHNYLNSLVAEAKVVAVSVDYRLAPEHPLPIAFEDSWAALKWVASHADGNGSEDWLNRYADLNRLFFAGDSCGSTLSHYLDMKLSSSESSEGLDIKPVGMVLVHPYFWGTEPVGEEESIPQAQRDFYASFWRFAYPLTSGSDDPVFNPGKDPKLGELACEKVLVYVAGKDGLRNRGVYYAEVLKKSGWKGSVELIEDKEEEHQFHLRINPTCENAVAMQKKIASFLN